MNLLLQIVAYLPRSWVYKAYGWYGRLEWWSHPWLAWAVNSAASRFKHRDGVIQQGIGRGLRLNPGDSTVSYLLGTAEPETQAVLAALVRPGMTVYDVGANVGFFSMIAARLVGPRGYVVCFEPLPINAYQIVHNAALNGFTHVLAREEALGREDGPSRFLVSRGSSHSRLASAGSVWWPMGELTVTVRRLDFLIAEAGLPKPDLIKIDVEGTEADVLAGAAQTLATARPLLLIELHGTNEPVARLLAEHGYSAAVLGSRARVIESPWNAHVIAVPEERADLASVLSFLADEAITRGHTIPAAKAR